MSAAIPLPVRQGTPEWLEARRSLITATALPILLALSPYRCEADLAAEMRGETEPVESNLRMRIGIALEDLIAARYAEKMGHPTRRVRGLWRSGDIDWAGASPDARAKGRLIELKWTGSRSRFADGLPQDVEAQVAWQAMVMGVPVVDVATLTVGDDDIRVFTVERDPDLEASLIAIASDFRRRLAAGGPFAESIDSLKRRYPADNGAEMVADADLAAAVHAWHEAKAAAKRDEANADAIESLVKTRMGEVALLRGPDFRVSWRRTKDIETTDWRSLADGLLRTLPETERTALVGLNTTVRPGFRPFRVVFDREED